MSELDQLKRRAEIKQAMSEAISTEEWNILPSTTRAEILLIFERISQLVTEQSCQKSTL